MTDEKKKGMSSNQLKFIISGGLFLIAVVILIVSATRGTAEFFMTVEELQRSENELQGQNLRVSGAVLGESIYFDPETGLLHFTIAHIPADEDLATEEGELSKVLHQAVNDPDNSRLDVIYEGAKPDMLRHESQAILTGQLNSEGVFVAEELLLKCPSKYEEALPEQAE
jgi:cytochrome c-type biogenesis protein CcmE